MEVETIKDNCQTA